MNAISARPAARYTVNTSKAVEVILWLAQARAGIDIYHIIKAAFIADKNHLNQYGRPVIGDDYKADVYGPRGECVWGLLRRQPLAVLALGDNGGDLPFSVDDENGWQVKATRSPNHRLLSASDVACLGAALSQVAGMSFDDLVDMTHDDPAYIAANGGRIRYEDLLNADDPQFQEKMSALFEDAREAVL